MIRLLSFLTLVCLFSLSTPAMARSAAHGDLPPCGTPRLEKVYVSAENVVVAAEGIFFLNEDGIAMPAQSVAIDSHGVYVFIYLDELYHCWECGRWSYGDTCQNPDCPLYGL